MITLLLALLVIVLFFGLSRAARVQVTRFLFGLVIFVVVVGVAGIAYLRSVSQERQTQQKAEQQATHRSGSIAAPTS